MKIYLNNNLSVLEYLYEITILEESEDDSSTECEHTLVMDIHNSDTVIGCNASMLVYDKTILITNENYDRDNLVTLSQFNTIISRFPLPLGLVQDYDLLPYKNVKLKEFRFNGSTNSTMSKLSIDKFIILKDDLGYHMKCPKLFLTTKVKGDMTIIGLLKQQND